MAWESAALETAVCNYFAAVDTKDVEETLAYFADDATMTIQTGNVTFTGTDGIRDMLTHFYEESATIVHEIRDIVIEPTKGKVAAEQDLFQQLHNGEKRRMHNCSFFDFNEAGEFQRVIIWMDGTNSLV